MDDTGTDQDDKAAVDEPTDDPGADQDPKADAARAPDDERLDELGDRIQSVRAEAEDVVEGVADTDEDSYAESGDKESTDEDDQTIAPG